MLFVAYIFGLGVSVQRPKSALSSIGTGKRTQIFTIVDDDEIAILWKTRDSSVPNVIIIIHAHFLTIIILTILSQS